MLFLLTFPSADFRASDSQGNKNLPKMSPGFSGMQKKGRGGRQPHWQNSQESALCRAVTPAISKVQSPVPWFQGSSNEFPACDRSRKPPQRGTVTFQLQTWLYFPGARLLLEPPEQHLCWVRAPLNQPCCPTALLPRSPSPAIMDPLQGLLGSQFAGMPVGARGRSHCWGSDSSCALGLWTGNKEGCFSLVLKMTPSQSQQFIFSETLVTNQYFLSGKKKNKTNKLLKTYTINSPMDTHKILACSSEYFCTTAKYFLREP